MTIILVTGTPGTGKTTIAKLIASRLNYKYIDVNDIIKQYNICDEYDSRRLCTIVDADKLKTILEKLIKSSKENLVIDSHMCHVISPKLVKMCLVTRCDLKTLKKRLETRGYNESKIRENLDAEIFENCLTEAQDNNHNLYIVDTTHLNEKQFIENVKKWLENSN